jgi:hypothetical protein
MTVRLLHGDCREVGRDAILIELNPAYVEIASRRIAADAPLFAEVSDA